jgi:hypothetical protein
MKKEHAREEKKSNKASPRERVQPSQSSLVIIRQYARCCRPIKKLPHGGQLIMLN